MIAQFDSLRRLPLADKLRLVEELWDDIGSSDEPFPWPEWLEPEAQRRAAEANQNPETLLTREELWQQVDRLQK